MRGSRLNPKLSAWAQVHGNYDFNRTPIAPPGIKVLVHEKPSNRNTWAPHAIEGWYVGPALQAYRCYCTWITETKRERIADTLTWFPTTAPMPTISSQDIIASATRDILQALQNPTNSSPIALTTDTETEVLKQLATILHNKAMEAADTKTTANTPTLLRVTPEATETEPDTTYHQTSKPKKRTNKHKQQRGTLAARDEDTVNAANYTMQLLQGTDTQTHYCFSAIHPDTGLPAEYRDLRTSSEGAEWIIETADEIGRLTQGNKETQVQGTNTMFFIRKDDIPKGRKPTYLRIVAADRPNKERTKRI